MPATPGGGVANRPAYPGLALGGDIPSGRKNGQKIMSVLSDLATVFAHARPTFLDHEGIFVMLVGVFKRDIWPTLDGSVLKNTLYSRGQQTFTTTNMTRDKLEQHVAVWIRALAPTLFGPMGDDRLLSVFGLRPADQARYDDITVLLFDVMCIMQVVQRIIEAAPKVAGGQFGIPYVSQLIWDALKFSDLALKHTNSPVKKSVLTPLMQERKLNIANDKLRAEEDKQREDESNERKRERQKEEEEHLKVVRELERLKATLPGPDSQAYTRAEALKASEELTKRLLQAIKDSHAQKTPDQPSAQKRQKLDDNVINSGEHVTQMLTQAKVKVSQSENQYVLTLLLEQLAAGKSWSITIDKVWAMMNSTIKPLTLTCMQDAEGNTHLTSQDGSQAKVLHLTQLMECIRYIAATLQQLNAVAAQHLLVNLPFAATEANTIVSGDIVPLKMYIDRVLRAYFDGIQTGTNIDLSYDADLMARCQRDVAAVRRQEQKCRDATQAIRAQFTNAGRGANTGRGRGGAAGRGAGRGQGSAIIYTDDVPSDEICRNWQRGHPCKVLIRATGRCKFQHTGEQHFRLPPPPAGQPPATAP
ncbi:MAG: hypothetical protein COB29_01115 [Sulfitobacter sp.]|nr:MAG: hypothetical protein COB29_01115 [Sulfitobacter sp.]